MLLSTVTLALLALAGGTLGQTNPTCPLLGPVFPPVQKGLAKSAAVKSAVARLTDELNEVVKKGTDTTLYVQAFSGTDKIFGYGYAPPSTSGSLTSGTLDENTVFRIGSVSKLITVYALLAEVGMERLNDPVTRWVPELARAMNHRDGPVKSPRWSEMTIGQLASHMSGIERNCKSPVAAFFIITNQHSHKLDFLTLASWLRPRARILRNSVCQLSRSKIYQVAISQLATRLVLEKVNREAQRSSRNMSNL